MLCALLRVLSMESFCFYSTATKKKVEDEDDMEMLAAWAS